MLLRVKAFPGTLENALTPQVWIARTAYVLLADIDKRLTRTCSFVEMPQVVRLNRFEKTPPGTAAARIPESSESPQHAGQLIAGRTRPGPVC